MTSRRGSTACRRNAVALDDLDRLAVSVDEQDHVLRAAWDDRGDVPEERLVRRRLHDPGRVDEGLGRRQRRRHHATRIMTRATASAHEAAAIARSAPSGPSISVARVTGSELPSLPGDLAAQRRHPTPNVAHLGREPALREAQRHRERGRGDGLGRDPPGGREVRGEQGKASPGEPEPQVGVEAAAGELEVVRAYDEDARGDERADPRVSRHGAVDPDRRSDRDRAGGEQGEHRRRDAGSERAPV